MFDKYVHVIAFFPNKLIIRMSRYFVYSVTKPLMGHNFFVNIK